MISRWGRAAPSKRGCKGPVPCLHRSIGNSYMSRTYFLWELARTTVDTSSFKSHCTSYTTCCLEALYANTYILHLKKSRNLTTIVRFIQMKVKRKSRGCGAPNYSHNSPSHTSVDESQRDHRLTKQKLTTEKRWRFFHQ